LAAGLAGWASALVVMGGALYFLGAACLATGRPNPRPATFGYHEVWHTSVVLASVCLYVVVFSLVQAAR
jgi:hemolysin III